MWIVVSFTANQAESSYSGGFDVNLDLDSSRHRRARGVPFQFSAWYSIAADWD
jgi:hypothetical protein